MRYALALALLQLAACGDAGTDPGPEDASTIGPDGAPCPSGWRVCPQSQRGNQCVPLSDIFNCGTCGNICVARGQSCSAFAPYHCE